LSCPGGDVGLVVGRRKIRGDGSQRRHSLERRELRHRLHQAVASRLSSSGSDTIRVMDLMGAPHRSQPIGVWTPAGGLNITNDRHRRRSGASGANDTADASLRLGNGTVIRVVSILNEPFVMLREGSENASDFRQRYHGFCIDLAEMVFAKLGVDWQLHLVEDGKYGAQEPSPDGSGELEWNGMMGEVIRGKADVAIASLTITSERSEYVLFSEPFMNFGLSVIIKKPQKTKPGMFSFMQPLEHQLWVAILMATMILAAVMALLARVSPLEWNLQDQPPPDQQRQRASGPGCSVEVDRYGRSQPTQRPLLRHQPVQTAERNFSLVNSLWFSFASFVQQGIDISPRSASTRIIGSCWWAFSLIIMAYYTANLTACLTIERLIAPIESVSDLANDAKGVKFGTLNSGSTKEFFRRSEEPTYKKMFELMERDKSVYTNSLAEGIDRVIRSDGKYAFILESKTNIYTNNRKPCVTMMVGQEFSLKGYGIAISQERHELRERINEAVLQLRESQDLDRKYKEWWIEKGECPEDGSPKLQPLAIGNLLGVFGILIAGLLLAMLTALLEFCCSSRGGFGVGDGGSRL
uniref:Glutamate receptor n=2 Tax=Macrostomum lignano TaxID=282301 RepID=A0A1I8HA92_9PLAT